MKIMKIPKAEAIRRRDELPYGAYIKPNGSEVLFNRSYIPMLERDKYGKNVQKASGWVEHSAQIWFYSDDCSPHDPDFANIEAYERCVAAKAAFINGQPVTPYIYRDNEE